MTRASCKTTITNLCAAEFDPKLADADLEWLVDESRIPDETGYSISDPLYEETFDAYYGVMRGWELKAARAAGDFRFEEDNQVFYREQVAQHCMNMAKRYNRRLKVVTDV